MRPQEPVSPRLPATHPDGGWGAQRPPLPAPPLDLDPAQCDGGSTPVTLRSLVLSASASAPSGVRVLRTGITAEECDAWSADPQEARHQAVRGGLRSLLGAALGAEPVAVALDDGPCPYCGRLHDFTAASPVGRRLHFATVRHGDFVVYAVCRSPVGLGLAVPDGLDPDALLRARKPARLAAHQGAVARGRCSRPRDGSVEYMVRYVDTAPEHGCVVSVVCELPRPAEHPGSRGPSTE
ncbi:hypothetical protein [Streptomyces sp. NBC_00057]|uniref:hypothetical protein n=1 Tax=Streptomyces sp. NBC_00057 TaxID=2975634 RepID=UPI003255C66A